MEQRSGGRGLGYLAIILASFMYASNGALTTQIFDVVDFRPSTMAAVRVYGAALILLIPVLIARPRLSRGDWIRVAAFGVFGVSLPQALYFEAIARAPLAIVLIIVYIAPVLVTLIDRLIHGRRLPVTAYLAIAIAVGGVLLAVTGGTDGSAISTIGVVLSLGTMLLYAGQIMITAVQPTTVGPFVRCGLGMLFGSAFWLIVMPIWSLPWEARHVAVDLGSRLDGSTPLWIAALYGIVIATVGAYSLMVIGAPRLGAAASSVTGMVEPVFAAALSWLLLGQRLNPIQIIGMGAALGGVTVAEVLRSRSLARALNHSSGQTDQSDPSGPLRHERHDPA